MPGRSDAIHTKDAKQADAPTMVASPVPDDSADAPVAVEDVALEPAEWSVSRDSVFQAEVGCLPDSPDSVSKVADDYSRDQDSDAPAGSAALQDSVDCRPRPPADSLLPAVHHHPAQDASAEFAASAELPHSQ